VIRRKGTTGATSTDALKYGGGFENFIPHDYTYAPRTNDRLAKLGSGAASRMISLASYDDDSKIFTFNDGMAHPKSGRARPEPDNWTLVDHGGLDRVWAHRDIVDHENHSASLAERSDQVINQKDSQCWAYKKDQWAVVEIRGLGPPIPKGREYNGAGFLPSLYATKKRGGSPKKGASGATFTHPDRTAAGFEFTPTETKSRQGRMRAALALNDADNGGYYTDLKRVAQLWHIFYMMPRPTPPPAGPKFKDVITGHSHYRGSQYVPGGGSYNPNDPQNQARRPGGETVAGRENHPIEEGRRSFGADADSDESGGPDSDCMVEPWVGAIPADVWIDREGKAAQLAWGDPEPALGDDPYYGWFWLGTPSPRHPGFRPAHDKSNDQPVLEHPDAPYGIRPVVPIPRHTGTPPCEVEPHFDPLTPAYSTDGVLPPAHTGGSADAGEWIPPSTLVGKAFAASDFRAGRLNYTMDSIPIPATKTDMRFMVTVPYQIPTALAGAEQIKLRLFYKVVTGAGSTAGDNWIEMTKTLTTGDNPISVDQVKHLTFEIPPLRLSQQGGGGRIYYWFMRRSDDTATGKPLRIVGNLQNTYAPARSRGRVGFGGAA
jgi:hypothetical protein